jgi:non-homologous end joining protein Ku
VNLTTTKTIAAAGGAVQTLDILAFVAAREIPLHYFETPYYLAPAPGSERMYALLHEVLRRTGKIGLACVEIEARLRIAALIPEGQSLLLLTLRWEVESRAAAEHDLKTREQSADIQILVPAYAPDEESQSDDDAFLAAALRRRPHAPDGYAMRAARGARPGRHIRH